MILRVRDNDGNILEIPAIKGDSGQDGITPERGIDYYTDKDKQDLIEEIKEGIGNVYVFKGSVDTFDSLPTADMNDETAGYVYNVTDTGVNYAWVAGENSGWDSLGMIYDVTDTVSETSDALITSSGVYKEVHNISYDNLNDKPFSKSYLIENTNLDYVFSDGLTGWLVLKEYSGTNVGLLHNKVIKVTYSRMGIKSVFTLKVTDNGSEYTGYDVDCDKYGVVSVKCHPSTNADFSVTTPLCVNLDGITDFNEVKDSISIEIYKVSTLDEEYIPDSIIEELNTKLNADEVQAMIDTSIGEYDEALLEIIGE